MTEIRVKENESLDSAFRRFIRACSRSGIFTDSNNLDPFEKKLARRQKKADAARKRKR